MSNLLKKSPKEILLENVQKGKIAEEIAKQDYLEHGYKIQRTGIGSDFIAEKQNGDTIYKEYVDVKSGKSQLTKKQRETKNQLKKRNVKYSVYRVTDEHLEFQIENNPEVQQVCKDIGYDISQFVGIFVVKDPTSGPNTQCSKRGLNSYGLSDILTNFGLRNMRDGTVRVQSWCRNICRRRK